MSEQVADCRVFKVREDFCERDSDGAQHSFFVIECPDWVNVIALTKQNDVVLIEQYRQGTEEIILEIPGGMIDADEEPEAAARRESLEEAGVAPDRVEHIGRYMLMQGGCDELMHLYCGRARLPEQAAAATHGLVHEGEDIRLLIMPAEDAFAMLDRNVIQNATCALTLFWLRQNHARLRTEWILE